MKRVRLIAAAGISVVMLSGFAGSVTATDHATVASKTIDTTTGECEKVNELPVLVGGGDCGAAVYGTDGFTGHIYGSGSGPIVDYICIHLQNAGSFTSYGGTYTFTVYDGDGNVIGTTTEMVTGGQACTTGNNAVTSGSVNVDFDANSGVVSYSVSIEGVNAGNATDTFTGDNSILNRVVGLGDGQANSASVAPPSPVAEVPEAPASVLLVVTAGLGSLAFIARRRGSLGTA
jgi:hypothetical protein